MSLYAPAQKRSPFGTGNQAGLGITGDPMGLAVTAFVCLDFIYAIAFNHLPDGLRIQLAALIMGGQAGLAGVSLIVRPNWWRMRVTFLITVLPFVWLLAHLILQQAISFPDMLRYLGPVYMGVLIFGHFDRVPVRLVLLLAVLTILFAVFWGLTQPAYFHSGETEGSNIRRWAPFHGGTANPHSSAYMAFSCVLIIHQALHWNYVRDKAVRLACWGVMALGMFYVFKSYSTQVLFAALVYAGLWFLVAIRIPRTIKVVVTIAGLLLVTGVVVENEVRKASVRVDTDVTVEDYGSGRIGTWIDRLRLIASRDPGTLWLGSGIGSDNFNSSTWVYKTTKAHNTYITMVIEAGILGAIAFFAALIMLTRGLGLYGWALFSPIYVSALVGNGLSLRPASFIIFFLAVAICIQGMMVRRQQMINARQAREAALEAHGRRRDGRPLPDEHYF